MSLNSLLKLNHLKNKKRSSINFLRTIIMKSTGIKLVFFIISMIVFSCNAPREDANTTDLKVFDMTMEEVVATMKPYNGPFTLRSSQ